MARTLKEFEEKFNTENVKTSLFTVSLFDTNLLNQYMW